MQTALTVRVPPELHDRLADHRRDTGVRTAEFIRRAAEEKLARDGFPPSRQEGRKAKQPA